ncbi:hypothetical protein SAMN02745117_00988 [Lampropedia hyalina DSM 16112]|uniref:Lipoprotein n=1 Tax=Lampropedia hyalina DSM 16112 TaxID=1122156 RepID=A0A1M4X474_9BURK|nr:hypothetical protein [Lampropedia hyalina]SHE88265.1 hypothetical protein SAMN02745117_00988 [Lampropedia hyalina DSM 16112]
MKTSIPSPIRLSCLFLLAVAALAGCGGNDAPALDDTAAHCFDDALHTPGNTLVVTYQDPQQDASVNVFTKTIQTLSDNAEFAGETGLKQIEEKVVRQAFFTMGWGNYTRHLFMRPHEDQSHTVYGSTYESGQALAWSRSTTVYTPAYRDSLRLLKKDETLEYTQTGNVHIQQNVSPYEYDRHIESKVTARYLGDEKISVPAGEFTACKFTINERTEWVYRGAVLKALTGETESYRVQKIELNGQPY